MKLATLFLAAITGVAACPGTDGTLRDLKRKLPRRATQEAPSEFDSTEMIGDLATVGATTKVGNDIKDILLGNTDPYSDVRMGLLSKFTCLLPGADVCCIWTVISKDMENTFRGSAGRCNQLAREAVRFGFHDAGAWSKTTGYGGADGSILLAGEMSRSENKGLEEIAVVMQGWYNTYKSYGVGMADLIQMGATVATVVCPLGPRIRSFVGRKDSSRPNADNLLPPATQSADWLIELFKNKTIHEHGLTALVGAHTTSQQRNFDPSRALDPQDSTPGVWDVKFYGQTLGTEKTPPRVLKFPSDIVLSQHPNIADEWKKFASDGGQDDWNEDYAKEYVRLSLLGVNNINNLKECTKVLPPAIKSFSNPDQKVIDTWLNTLTTAKSQMQKISEELNNGGNLNALTDVLKGLKQILGFVL